MHCNHRVAIAQVELEQSKSEQPFNCPQYLFYLTVR
jgi:hypothetical protein